MCLNKFSFLLAIFLTPCASQVVKADEIKRNESVGADETNVSVGMSAAFVPRYMGASVYKFVALPVLSVERGPFFMDMTRGIGLQSFLSSGTYASVSLGYDYGRTDKFSIWGGGSRRLKGLEKVRSTTTLHSLIVQSLSDRLSVNLEGDIGLGKRAQRIDMRLGSDYTIFSTDNDKIALDIGLLWGNKKYNQAYFGVTQEESMNSGRSYFRASEGVYRYDYGIAWDHKLNKNWSTSFQISVDSYADDVRRSSVVSAKESVNLSTAITYAY